MKRFESGSSWLLRKARRGQIWCALFGLALALSLASLAEKAWASSVVEPHRFDDRALDPSIADTLSVAASELPGGVFYLTLGLSFLVLYLGLSLFNGWVGRVLDGEAVDGEKTGVLLLSQISLALYALHSIAQAGVPESLRTLVHLFAGLLVMSMAAKGFVRPRLRRGSRWAVVWNLLRDDSFMLAGLFMPASVISVAGLVGGRLNPLAGMPIILAFCIYLIVLLALLGSYLLVAGRRFTAARPGTALALYDLNTAVIVGGAPLVLIPLGLLLANEMQFGSPESSPRTLGLLWVAMLVTASVALFVWRRKGKVKIGGVAMLAGFYFPALVATLASFKTHLWTLDLGTLDYLRSGDLVVPTQQWAEFGKTPFLNLLPVQGLADVGIPSLYTLFHGLSGLDMLVWLPWIPIAVGFLVIYAFLALVTSPILALLVTVLLPIRAIVVGQYALALLPGAILATVIRRPSFRRFVALWSVTALVLLWRPQLGWPAAWAVLAVVGLIALFENRALVWQAVSSLVLVVGLFPAGLLVAEVAGDGDTSAAVRGYFELLWSSSARGFGAIEVGSGMSGMALLLLGLLPALAVICLLLYLVRRLVRREPVTPRGYAVLYLVVFSLLIPARISTEASSQFLDPSLLLLVLLLVPFLAIDSAFRPRQLGRSAWVMATLVFAATLGPVGILHLVGGGADHSHLRTWRPRESRVLFNPRPHKNLVEFLQSELAAKETFLDFTGSTVLYALSAQRYPLDALTDFRRTSESVQSRQLSTLKDRRSARNLPLVVFRSRADSESKRGELPTEVLSYRIAEFIYSDYTPVAKIDGWEIWRVRGERRQAPVEPAKPISASSIRQHFKLGYLPYRWAREDPWQSVTGTEVLAPVLDRSTIVRAGKKQTLAWKPEVGPTAATYLHLQARPLPESRLSALVTESPTITVSYGAEPQNTIVIQLAPAGNDSEGHQALSLPLISDPKRHDLRWVKGHPDGLAFRPTGRDPWLRRFADLSQMPAVEAGTNQWITMRYMSTVNGTAQFYFAEENGQFGEKHSVRIPVSANAVDEAPRTISVPVVGVGQGNRLGQLRFDPPPEGQFHIVSLELSLRQSRADDYLVRMTTQFQWTQGETHELSLRSDAPVVLESVVLRRGD